MRLLRLTMVIAVTVGVLVSDYGETQATARSKAGRYWAYAFAATVTPPSPPCVNVNAGLWPVSASCWSISPVGFAWANAHAKPGRKKKRKATHGTFTLGLAWAKDGSNSADTVITRDTLDFEVDTVGADPQKAAIHIWGYLQTYKPQCNPVASFEAIAYEVPSQDTCFYGGGKLVGRQLITSGSLQPSDFTIQYVGDSTFVYINYYDTVSYLGVEDSLYVDLITHGVSRPTPIMTHWGMLILVALLIASTVFILLKRRKAVVSLR